MCGGASEKAVPPFVKRACKIHLSAKARSPPPTIAPHHPSPRLYRHGCIGIIKCTCCKYRYENIVEQRSRWHIMGTLMLAQCNIIALWAYFGDYRLAHRVLRFVFCITCSRPVKVTILLSHYFSVRRVVLVVSRNSLSYSISLYIMLYYIRYLVRVYIYILY